jgi:uncharacterized protein YndB with AHSA1/START domain
MADIIEKALTVNASADRVWRALTDYQEFGTWFRVALDGPFEVGKVTTGTTTYPGYEGLKFWVRPVVMQVPALFVFDWPWDPDASPDAATVPGSTTRVEFRLEKASSGTLIRLRESGFDKLPPDVAPRKLRDNEGGWTIQMQNIRAHVDD